MKRKQKILTALLAAALLLTLLLPPFAMLALQKLLPPVFGESYYAALQDKYAALREGDGKRRILLIGGSGTAFSVDGALLEEETGLPCVNFSLYAAFGTQYMMELAEPHIGKGDIVVIAPELSSQTLSMYFGADAALRASEGAPSLLLRARWKDYFSLLAEFPAYFQSKLSFLLPEDGAPPKNDGVYSRASFDEKGNMTFLREENLMPYGYLPDALPDVSPAAYSEEFLNYLCLYAEKVRGKGAEIYYAFPFMNRLSLEKVTEKQKSALEDFLLSRLNFPLLSSLSARILDEGYFYDSNYHTTTDGMTAATLRLASDLKRILGDSSPLKSEAPPPLTLDFSDSEDGEELTDGIYRYRLVNGGARLTGLTDEGKKRTSLSLPETLGGHPLTALGRECLAESGAETVTVPAGVKTLEGALFRGCPVLREMHLRCGDLPGVGETLLDGFDGSLRIYVPAVLYDNYLTDYFWAPYGEFLEKEP